MAYLKKITVQLSNGTAEKIAVGSLEKEILEKVKEKIQVWRIAENFAISQHYRDVIYQTAINLQKKGLVELSHDGPRGGLTITLTEKAKAVLKIIDELKQIDKKDSDKRICAPYETC